MSVQREEIHKMIDRFSEKNLSKIKETLETLLKYEDEIEEENPTKEEKIIIDEALKEDFHSFEEIFGDSLNEKKA
ncbi:hypothetical protein M670_03467 [Schinkia azotoformans MEV2011]|uniref:Uncharacterized protein n=1 Tax=Schinkia azotoformans MEV2011 TaxID=1348973 RepID=A0A072NIA3_SCHAZ|nr:hypothetical protein [Schinkia azotoformans]KEF37221.1 hypothetical protein M670_03467 [Schinkia azotoformans MEV2011]MEC1698276.1 hypothetical protein [Schinkia azotoformans]MEC1727012.1 hypothetical protein [Schinkia azotoformans]MEC1773307.1 hypothetical protein [Schinkia azotoformans]MED4364934.1 hypothetical protein [Schinkia azotoformans]